MAYYNLVNATSDRFMFHAEKTYEDFAKADTTSDPVLLFRMPPRCVLRNMRIRHRVSFTGGDISAYVVSVGTVDLPEKYASHYNVYQAAAGTTFAIVQQLVSESCSTFTNIYAFADCVGDTLDHATAGNVQFSLEMIIL